MTCAPPIESARIPIDLAVLTFDADGCTRVMSELCELIDRGVIRIIELGVVEMTEEGSLRHLSEQEIFGRTTVLAPPLLAGTLPAVADRLAPGTSAMVVVWENLWATGLTAALRDASSSLVETTSSVFEVCDQV